LKEEPESEIRAAQAQALKTKYRATKIFQSETESKYSLCQKYD